MSRTKSIVFLSVSLLLFSACDIVSPPKEVQETLSFETNGAPEPGRQIKRIIGQINQAVMEEAIKDGSPTTLQFKDNPSNKKTNRPDIDDMVLLPLFSRVALEEAATSWMKLNHGKRSELTPEVLDKIDFKSQFALLVAHPAPVYAQSNFDFSGPAQMSAQYFDTVLIKRSPADILKIQLKTGRLGNPPLFPVTWQSKIYLLDRKNYKLLQIQLDEDSYDYKILSATEIIGNKN